jgi:hypothetical protein
MVSKTKAKSKPMTWILGDKKRGISVYKLNYPSTYNPWRAAYWRNGKQIRTEEYPTRREALQEARAKARINFVG